MVGNEKEEEDETKNYTTFRDKTNEKQRKEQKENQIHSHIIITNIKRINIFIQIHAK